MTCGTGRVDERSDDALVWLRRETRIADARDLGMRREMLRHAERALALTSHAQVERPHAADAQPGLVRRQVRAVEDGPIAHRLRDLGAPGDAAAHDVAVTVDVLGERVDDDVGA